MDENTAAALLFAVDNVYEQPTNIVFYNLGASSLQVRPSARQAVHAVCLPERLARRDAANCP